MRRCLQIAKNGLGTTRPNPMVGCVIVHNNKIIGEGFTSPYGGPHAEVNAIKAVKDTALLSKSTLYVSLEPCAHHGKTPPCADLIVKFEIPNVVIGCLDNNPLVAGRGIERLKIAGCHVIYGVLKDECRHQNRRFFTMIDKGRPYIILKWAQTADGFIAPQTKSESKPVWISSDISRQLVHKWRAEEHAILVGAKTVLVDNPRLSVRYWTGKDPVKIVLDKDSSLKKDFNIFDKKTETCTFKNIDDFCNAMFPEGTLSSVLVEGGAKTLQAFIDKGLWDEARVFTGPVKFGQGIKAPLFMGKLLSETKIENDTLRIYAHD